MSWQTLTDNLTKSCVATFGRSVVYTPSGLSAVSITAIFDRTYQAVDPDSGAIISSTAPMLMVRLADLPRDPAPGDRVAIDGENYRVNESQPDGGGGARLALHKLS